MKKRNRWCNIVAVMFQAGRRLELVKGRSSWFVLVDGIPAHPTRTLSDQTAGEWWDMAPLRLGRRPAMA